MTAVVAEAPAPGAPAADLADPAAPALTVLTGPAGIGRTHALATLRESLTAAGRPVLDLRIAPEDRDEPWFLASRVLAALAPIPGRLAAGRGRVAGEPPAAALTRLLSRRPGLVLLVDDVQWADPDSAEALLAALLETARTPVRCVAALRGGPGRDLPPRLRDGFARLAAAGAARVTPLRPLRPAEADAVVLRVLQAAPHESLRAELRRLSRGVPAALLAAVEGYRGTAALRIADRRAYLADVTVPPHIPADHELTRPVRRLGADPHAVARALAVLEPLGSAVPTLIGRALNLPPDRVLAGLTALRDEGVARRSARGWGIPVPAMAVALGAGLGPYERRRLAQVAVAALRSGEATSRDPGFLPDQAVIAGGLADAGQTLALLRERAAAAALRSPAAAARWWSGAADLSGDPADRAEALLTRAGAEFAAGRYASAQAHLTHLLTEHAGALGTAPRQEAELLSLACARGERGGGVTAAAAGEPWLPGGPEPGALTRAAALCMLDRWAEAARAAGSTVDETALSGLIGAQVTAVIGRSGPRGGGSDVEPGAARRQAAAAVTRLRLALVAGDLTGAREALTAAGLGAASPALRRGSAMAGPQPAAPHRGAAPTRTPDGVGSAQAEAGPDLLAVPERALLDWRAGAWDAALDAAQFALAADLAVTRPAGHAALHRAAAEILLARGWPSRARAMLEAARADAAPLPHLLAPVAAELEWVLGDPAAAAATVTGALDEAARRGLLLGTDELWPLAAELARERGDDPAARHAAAGASTAATALGTEIAALRAAVAGLVAGDPAGAADVVARARELGQPYELARTLERVVRWTGHRPDLLGEAYDLLGDLGAVLHRSRVRQAMREHGLAVPGRSETLAEGEQLLAALVAEGLSNRQLAAATQSSEKSVEGRLSRLFTRTGYRSRVELAAAVLVGDYRV